MWVQQVRCYCEHGIVSGCEHMCVDMNEKSSRAHTVFRLIIESKDANGGARSPIRSSTLYHSHAYHVYDND